MNVRTRQQTGRVLEMADRTKARWDTMTLEQYRRIHGEPPRDAPRPWWMISGEKPPPESPRRLVRRGAAASTRAEPSDRPRRRLVRVGRRGDLACTPPRSRPKPLAQEGCHPGRPFAVLAYDGGNLPTPQFDDDVCYGNSTAAANHTRADDPHTLGSSVCPTSGLSTRGETTRRASIRVSVRPGRRPYSRVV